MPPESLLLIFPLSPSKHRLSSLHLSLWYTVMKLRSSLLVPGLLMLFSLLGKQPVMESPEQKIQQFIKKAYGTALEITDEQISQLSWILDNPVKTPEMDVAYTYGGRTETIHREVPRTLSRLYNLQLLRSGTEKDYRTFVAPQLNEAPLFLSYERFKVLSQIVQENSEESLEVLKAATIIKGVALSPKAKERADVILEKVPADSNQFLSETARHISAIYPLARSVIKCYPEAEDKFKTVFLPDTNLQHMLYGEGSQAMFTGFRVLASKESHRKDFTLWRDHADIKLWLSHWLVSLSGFRGHLAPGGSLYLNQYEADALKSFIDATSAHSTNPESPNELSAYIAERAWSLNLGRTNTVKLLNDPSDRTKAIALLAAQARVYTEEQGKKLEKAFEALSADDQERWIQHATRQFTVQPEATPTYGPALFANGIALKGLEQAVVKLVPLILDATEQANELRKQEQMNWETPLSFRSLAMKENIEGILAEEGKPELVIDPDTGTISLKPVEKAISEEKEASEPQETSPRKTTRYITLRFRHLLPSL